MLRIGSLSKRYGDVVALDNCSFEVDRGCAVQMDLQDPNGLGSIIPERA
jgi:ABC-type Na+ transport system ATPase subunit NatA